MFIDSVICVIISKDKWVSLNEDHYPIYPIHFPPPLLTNSMKSLCTVYKKNVYANAFKKACWSYKTYY